MLIDGYAPGPLFAAEALLDRPGFWPHHLLGLCHATAAATTDTEPPQPEWFGADGADTDALAEELEDDRAWPVFTVAFAGGHALLVVYRNQDGARGVEHLLVHPEWSRPELVTATDDPRYGPGLSWPELTRIVDAPPPAGPGVLAPEARLLLLLPALAAAPRHVAAATARVARALLAVGAPPATAPATAARLLRATRTDPGHDPDALSPLSGGTPAPAGAAPRSALLRTVSLAPSAHRALARALAGQPRTP
ncbi:hypothetical protein [Kitasatospora phosalacinea]|uniref:Uncharacterized protein n=1 Tax=Kitasatospora phosalacinea TaxID=2065 RepID=A0A9W6PC56_9ACTN|nr:hypothetical protein [Kitasatospora phosalacinea]GLW52263.1 hypothetical protein Kpho01_02740 [Kitasatospora phosalacinea]